MVTKIVNNTSNDIVFYTQNIANFLRDKSKKSAYAPIRRVVKAGETLYSRSVTGDTKLEAELAAQGCTLSRVRRSYIIILAGQSNAVGYDESPWDEEDVKPLPYCYYEAMKKHGGYSAASQVPFINVGFDTYQDMQNNGSTQARTKGIAYELAKNFIGFVPDDYELEIFGYCYGGSYVVKNAGQVGSTDSSNMPQNSSRWNSDGALSIASYRRLCLHFGNIQPESKLVGMVWCQGEHDGSNGSTAEQYKEGFEATIGMFHKAGITAYSNNGKSYIADWSQNMLFPQYALNTKFAYRQNVYTKNNDAFVQFTGGTFIVSSKGKKYFSRDNFRTNLSINDIEIEYYGSYTAGTTTTEADGTITTTDPVFANKQVLGSDGHYPYEIDFSDLSYSYYRNPEGGAGTNSYYAKLINKNDGTYIGYIALNGGISNAVATPEINYAQENVDTTNALRYPLIIAYPGIRDYWDKQKTFPQIMKWQEENLTGFVDIPAGTCKSNDGNPTGTKAQAWNGWCGYGITSTAKGSHYGQNAFRYIAKKLVERLIQIHAMIREDEAQGRA